MAASAVARKRLFLGATAELSTIDFLFSVMISPI